MIERKNPNFIPLAAPIYNILRVHKRTMLDFSKSAKPEDFFFCQIHVDDQVGLFETYPLQRFFKKKFRYYTSSKPAMAHASCVHRIERKIK